MQRPITEQRVAAIAASATGTPRSTLPDDLAGQHLGHWDVRAIPADHWPMLGWPEQLDHTLLAIASTTTP